MKTIARAFRALWGARVRILPVAGIFGVFALLYTALAYAATLQEKDNGSLQADGFDTTTVTNEAYRLIGGITSAGIVHGLQVNASGQLLVMPGSGSFGVSATDDAAFTHGTDSVTPAGFIFDDTLSNDPEENDVALARIDSKRAQVARIEGETRGLSADVLTTGADNTALTTNGLYTYAMLLGYESVGGVADLLRMDTSGYLYTTLATALDSSIDSISIAINDVIPQLDSTDRMAVSAYFFNAAAGDTQPTATTTQANDLALTLDTLNVTAVLMGGEGSTNADLDIIRVFNLGDDITYGDGTDDGLLGGLVLGALWDAEDSNVDRQYGYDYDGDSLTAPTEGVLAGSASFMYALDEAGTVDRVRLSQLTGFFTPATSTTTISVTTAESCTTDNVLTVGDYIVQTDATVWCELNADAATAAATTGDMRFENPGIYPIRTVATSQDTLCCVTAAGTATVNINKAGWN